MYLVSVIIPTYNRANIIQSAINSAIAQTYKNTEIIIVDDGSNDATADLIAGFGNKVKFIYKENGGVSSARNLGIRKSSGELIAFLDSDDVWLPEKLEKQVSFFEQNPDFGMVLCDCFFMNESREITDRFSRRQNLPNDGYILEDVFQNPYLVPSSVLVRKEVLDEIGSFDEQISTAEDLDLHLRIAMNYKIALIAEPLVKCMSGHEGLSMLPSTYDDHVFIVERFIRNHPNLIKESGAQKALFQTFLSAANGKFLFRAWREGIRYTYKTTKCIASIYDLMAVFKIMLKGVSYFLRGLTTRIISEIVL
jgi:glycosyltransferase involved in cell wall biosynthesis